MFQNSNELASENVEKFLKEFVQQPHPMGSDAQKKLALKYEKTLAEFSLQSHIQKFVAQTPYTENSKIKWHKTEGFNVIGKIERQQKCAIIFAGHYDTKYFSDITFVGANDGGSSTALILELARAAKKKHFPQNSLGNCSLYFVLLDGEESMLPEWNEGKNLFGQQDNLYGSRAFADEYIQRKESGVHIEKNTILLTFILDMVGHKNQILDITAGSQSNAGKKLIEVCSKVKISQKYYLMEDDHIPFLKKKVPVLHIIDWSNIQEWHTAKDTLDILSPDKIANFGNCLIDFLMQK